MPSVQYARLCFGTPGPSALPAGLLVASGQAYRDELWGVDSLVGSLNFESVTPFQRPARRRSRWRAAPRRWGMKIGPVASPDSPHLQPPCQPEAVPAASASNWACGRTVMKANPVTARSPPVTGNAVTPGFVASPDSPPYRSLYIYSLRKYER